MLVDISLIILLIIQIVFKDDNLGSSRNFWISIIRYWSMQNNELSFASVSMVRKSNYTLITKSTTSNVIIIK